MQARSGKRWGWGVMHYVDQEKKLDVTTVETKSLQLESCSSKLAVNPVNLVAALT